MSVHISSCWLQVVVEALAGHQLLMGALLHEPALLEDEDEVGVADGAEPVGDHEGRASLQQLVDVLLDGAL